MNTNETKTPWIAKILVVLVGAAVLAAGVALFAVLIKRGFHWRLILYLAILLSPFYYCIWRRGAWLWRAGFHLAPRRESWWLYAGTLLMFFSLATLLYSYELWRGKRAYASLEREVAARGDTLELSAVIPPPVPDDQNFCATPLLAALMDYELDSPPLNWETRWRKPEIINRLESMRLPNPEKGGPPFGFRDMPSAPSRSDRPYWFRAEMTDLGAWQKAFANNTNYLAAASSHRPAEAVLVALSRFDPELNELRAANQRPAARWALHYQDGWWVMFNNGVRFGGLGNLVKILDLRATAELALGQTDAALPDVKLALRLADSMRQEPSLPIHQLRQDLLLASLQSVWEGLVTHRWTDNQLAELQARFSQFDPTSDRQTVLRGETYLSMEFFRLQKEFISLKTIRTHFRQLLPDGIIYLYTLMWLSHPTGWYYQDQVYLYRLYERAMAARPGLATTSPPPAGKAEHLERPEDPWLAVFLDPRLREMYGRARTLDYATALEEARLACALERYRLAHGEYPATLAELTPRFNDQRPRTAASPRPLLEYRRTTPGQFLLYPAGMTNVSETWQISAAMLQTWLKGYPGMSKQLWEKQLKMLASLLETQESASQRAFVLQECLPLRGSDFDGVWRFPAMTVKTNALSR